MRVLALVPYPYNTAPGQRYRMEQWAPFLQQYGVKVSFEAFRCEELHTLLFEPANTWRKALLTFKALARRRESLKSIESFDLVYIYNEAAMVGPAFIENHITRRGVPLVFDFDDAIFLRSKNMSPINRYLRLLKFPGKTSTICQLSSHVIAGNAYLASYASRFNSEVTTVPTTIDTEIYTVEQSKAVADPPVIGWSGSYSTVQHLDTLRGVLERLAQQERFRLRVIGTSSYQLKGVEVEAMPWRPETEVADLRRIDIGIMPLPDNEWTRGKCGLKALQYMALGIPTVCSPVGVNSSIIQSHQNGLLAATEDQWIEYLTLLLHSPSLREQLGRAGRTTVEAGYSKSIHAPRVNQILQEVVRQKTQKRYAANRSSKM